jgi:hypothetical protein
MGLEALVTLLSSAAKGCNPCRQGLGVIQGQQRSVPTVDPIKALLGLTFPQSTRMPHSHQHHSGPLELEL